MFSVFFGWSVVQTWSVVIQTDLDKHGHRLVGPARLLGHFLVLPEDVVGHTHDQCLQTALVRGGEALRP